MRFDTPVRPLRVTAVALVAFGAGALEAQECSRNCFRVPVEAPLVRRLTTTVPTPDGDLRVDLNLRYDERGRVACLDREGARCRVGGELVEVSGRLRRTAAGVWAYSLKLTGVDVKLVVRLRGRIGEGTARLSYGGPDGRVRRKDHPVAIGLGSNLGGRIVLEPQIGERGVITGAARVATGLPQDGDGLVVGRVRGNRLRLRIRSGRGTVDFRGSFLERDAARPFVVRYLGTLRVRLAPERATIRDFVVPLDLRD